jgi:hypothetical protein
MSCTAGKRHLVEQVLQLAAPRSRAAGGFLHQRKVFSWQRLQGETALPPFKINLFCADSGNGLVAGHGTQDVDELANNRCRETATVAIKLCVGADLNFQVAVVSWICEPVLRINTFARIGRVWRRSTMPATD